VRIGVEFEQNNTLMLLFLFLLLCCCEGFCFCRISRTKRVIEKLREFAPTILVYQFTLALTNILSLSLSLIWPPFYEWVQYSLGKPFVVLLFSIKAYQAQPNYTKKTAAKQFSSLNSLWVWIHNITDVCLFVC